MLYRLLQYVVIHNHEEKENSPEQAHSSSWSYESQPMG